MLGYEIEDIRSDTSMLPEQKLMRAIVVQALIDAYKPRDLNATWQKNEYGTEQRRARAWFRTKHFETVCDLADLNPDFIRTKVAQNVHRYKNNNGQGGAKHAR